MTGPNAKKLRQKRGMNQSEFWNRVGVTQSARSRLESGQRRVSKPVHMLLVLAYGHPRNRESLLRTLGAIPSAPQWP